MNDEVKAIRSYFIVQAYCVRPSNEARSTAI
jgi:hypothetical protein